MANAFPPLSRNDILAFQFSSWYSRFKHVSMKSTTIHPLGDDFKHYLLSDGVHIPEGSDNNVCVGLVLPKVLLALKRRNWNKPREFRRDTD